VLCESGECDEHGDSECRAIGNTPSRQVDWLIIGAESIGSRPGRECRIEWVESLVEQAKSAGIPAFVKQIHLRVNGKLRLVKDVTKFPKHLRVQEYSR
jgi:protein gp37